MNSESPNCEPLGLEGFTNEELAQELMDRCKRGVVLMRFDNEEGPRKLSLYQGTLDEVVGVMENELFYQKYADAKDRHDDE